MLRPARAARVLPVLALAVLCKPCGGARLTRLDILSETDTNESAALVKETYAVYRAQHAQVLNSTVILDYTAIAIWAIEKSQKLLTQVSVSVGPVLLEGFADFMRILKEFIAKCLLAMQDLKVELRQELVELKSVAVGELPKVWDKLSGLRQRLIEAREAVTTQLLSGSLVMAGQVMQQQLDRITEEAKKSTGLVKEQLLTSAKMLLARLQPILQEAVSRTKDKFSIAFSEAMQNSTELVGRMLGEIKAKLAAEIKNFAEAELAEVSGLTRNLANEVTRKLPPEAQAALAQVLAPVAELATQLPPATQSDKVSALLEASDLLEAAALQGFSHNMALDLCQQPNLTAQQATLEAAVGNLLDAAAQSGSAFAEGLADTAAGLGKQLGLYLEEVQGDLPKDVKEEKLKEIDHLRSTLVDLQTAVNKSAGTTTAALSSAAAAANASAAELEGKWGDAAASVAEHLRMQARALQEAGASLGDAASALAAAISPEAAEKRGRLLAEVVRNAADTTRMELSQLEVEFLELREKAQKQTKEARRLLEAALSTAAQKIGEMTYKLRGASSDQPKDKSAIKEQITAAKHHTVVLQSISREHVAKGRQVLQFAAQVLEKELSHATEDEDEEGDPLNAWWFLD